jgi:hypothetical protein
MFVSCKISLGSASLATDRAGPIGVHDLEWFERRWWRRGSGGLAQLCWHLRLPRRYLG